MLPPNSSVPSSDISRSLRRSSWALVVLAAAILSVGLLAGTGCSSHKQSSTAGQGQRLPLSTGQNNAVSDWPSQGDSTIGISFKYPPKWHVELQPEVSTSTPGVDVSFFTDSAPSSDNGSASIGIDRYNNSANTSLDSWIRNTVGDTGHLLALQPCSFQNHATECLEVADQAKWQKAGNPPTQTTIFFRVPGYVYGVAWGQTDTFNFPETSGPQILSTLRFTASP